MVRLWIEDVNDMVLCSLCFEIVVDYVKIMFDIIGFFDWDCVVNGVVG